MLRTALVSIAFWMAATSADTADRLPVADGVYLSSNGKCRDYHRGELDMLDYEITNGGQSYNTSEAGCVIAGLKTIRKGRLAVEADCKETGDIFQMSFILDVIPTGFRVDGEEFRLCQTDTAPVRVLPPERAQPARNVDKLSKFRVKALIEKWHSQNERCRGGSGDDPETEKACERRKSVHKALAKKAMCYGKIGQAASEFQWHKCGKRSLREPG